MASRDRSSTRLESMGVSRMGVLESATGALAAKAVKAARAARRLLV